MLLLTTGCAISQEKFVEKFAAEKCQNIDDCGKLSELHGTLEECIKGYEIIADEEMVGDDCAIISDKARECLKELRKTNGECPVTDAQSPACAEVGDCKGGSSGDSGL
jgi:hypothetical protein